MAIKNSIKTIEDVKAKLDSLTPFRYHGEFFQNLLIPLIEQGFENDKPEEFEIGYLIHLLTKLKDTSRDLIAEIFPLLSKRECLQNLLDYVKENGSLPSDEGGIEGMFDSPNEALIAGWNASHDMRHYPLLEDVASSFEREIQDLEAEMRELAPEYFAPECPFCHKVLEEGSSCSCHDSIIISALEMNQVTTQAEFMKAFLNRKGLIRNYSEDDVECHAHLIIEQFTRDNPKWIVIAKQGTQEVYIRIQ